MFRCDSFQKPADINYITIVPFLQTTVCIVIQFALQNTAVHSHQSIEYFLQNVCLKCFVRIFIQMFNDVSHVLVSNIMPFTSTITDH